MVIENQSSLEILKKLYFCRGEMAEWSIAAVLKTVELKGSGGSNPSLSAGNKSKITQTTEFTTSSVVFYFALKAK